MGKPSLKVLENEFSIYRYQADEPIPSSVFNSTFYWIGKTDEELSIVCDSSMELVGGECNSGWSCFKVLGPIDFLEIGVLTEISAILALAQISIFAISTFDTDYILVKSAYRNRAEDALKKAGYGVKVD